ncbi:hypothetical protein [Enterobacter sp. Lyrl_3]|uniref:hypothetical protein n=1 Tax=Enterobacter sp. Lyrl_3 TaxID=3110922 RepID=UPI003F7CEB61
MRLQVKQSYVRDVAQHPHARSAAPCPGNLPGTPDRLIIRMGVLFGKKKNGGGANLKNDNDAVMGLRKAPPLRVAVQLL